LQQQHPIPQQQQHQMQGQSTGGYSHPSQQQQQNMQQQQLPQLYGQQSNYRHQSSNAGSTQSDSQSSTVTGAPLNFQTSPTIDAMTGAVGGSNGGGPEEDYGQQFLPSGLNGDWQSDNDMHHRREMIQHM
jgi:hypothetical protein